MVKFNDFFNFRRGTDSKSSLDGQRKIPIVVGVAGHRNIRNEDLDNLKNSIVRELENLKESCPHSEILMLSTLTRGGDTLSSLCAIQLGIKLVCALPMPLEEYRKDFSDDELETFDKLLDYASDVFVVPNTEEIPEDAGREFYYRQAGIYIASHSHLLLALWDGTKLGEGNYGTSKMVDLMLNGTFLPKNGKAMYTGENEAVLHIFAPNENSVVDSSKEIGETEWLGNIDNFNGSLQKTDEFNHLLEGAGDNGYELLPNRDFDDYIIDRLEYFFSKADSLSLKFQSTYTRVLMRLAIIGTVITFGFLIYEKLEVHWFILICGIMLIFAAVELYLAKKSDCQNHYIEYRTLAEGLRVQVFLRYAGSSLQASELFTWSQQIEKAWIMKAIRAVSIGPLPSGKNDVVEAWITNQKIYHKNASSNVKKDYERHERRLHLAIIGSIFLYLVAMIFEFTAGDLTWNPIFNISEPHMYRIWIAVFLGLISAATLFIANFYGKLSLSRKASDHENMGIFYERMEEQLNRFGQSEELLRYIAHEELIENSNWCSYQSDNKIDLEIG